MILIIYQTPCLSSAAVNQASMGLALHFDDVGQLPDLVEHAAQIGDTGDLHREGHVGEVLLFVGPCLHGDHVDLVVGQHRGNVAQEAVAVDCDNAYVDGVGLLLPAPPQAAAPFHPLVVGFAAAAPSPSLLPPPAPPPLHLLLEGRATGRDAG